MVPFLPIGSAFLVSFLDPPSPNRVTVTEGQQPLPEEVSDGTKCGYLTGAETPAHVRGTLWVITPPYGDTLHSKKTRNTESHVGMSLF